MVVCRQCGTANDNTLSACVKCRQPLRGEHMQGKISCQVHANREATTTCNGCGARLCDACAYTLGGIDFCENCAPEGAISTDHDEDYERIPVVDSRRTERANFDSRFLSALVDLGILVAVGGVMWIVFTLSGKPLAPVRPMEHPTAFGLFWGILFLGTLVYQTILNAMTGQTIGKQLCGVIVLEPDGRILSLGNAAKRAVCALISLLPLGAGYLWAIWDKNGETWHDKLSKTAVFKYTEIR